MCRLHCKGCTRDNIFFDRAGETAALLDKGYTTDDHIPDTLRAINTYWFHIQMLVKYFKRGDILKLIKNINEIIFRAHADLLLSLYDALDWGPWETKVKRCVPEELQAHLLVYFAPADFAALRTAVEKGMALFQRDAEMICAAKGLRYPKTTADQIAEYFHKKMTLDRQPV
jgi:hypothetical protein